MPTIYLSSWSSHHTPGAHGPGRKWTIMARPRRWEHGEGSVPLLVPPAEDVLDTKNGSLATEEYRSRYLRLLAFRVKVKKVGVGPGTLLASTPLDPVLVADGDTLLCACSVAAAREGRCHRAWAAALLSASGWDVVLDGVPLPPEEAVTRLRAWVAAR